MEDIFFDLDPLPSHITMMMANPLIPHPYITNSLGLQPISINRVKDDKTEDNTFEILQHSDRNINNS